MKIIFLDIDGVLNYWGCKSLLHGILFVDDKKLKLLKQIVDATDAKIVLSSTWRFGSYPETYNSIAEQDYNNLKEKLTEYGFTIFDCTPLSKSGYRGIEIAEWLEVHKDYDIESFIVLDDDCDMKPVGSRLIQTSFTKGLCENHVQKAIKMLNENFKFSIDKT